MIARQIALTTSAHAGEPLACDHTRQHRMGRVEIAREVLTVGPDLEVEEIVHEVVGHVREHDAGRGEREPSPRHVRARGTPRAARRARRRRASSAVRRRGSGTATSTPDRADRAVDWSLPARTSSCRRRCAARPEPRSSARCQPCGEPRCATAARTPGGSAAVVHPGVLHAEHGCVLVLEERGVHDLTEEERVIADLDRPANLALDVRDRLREQRVRR